MKYILLIMLITCSGAFASTIDDQLTAISNAKAAIKAAIEAMGVTVGTAPFVDYGDKISDIIAPKAGITIQAELAETVVLGDIVTVANGIASKFVNPLGDTATFSADITHFGYAQAAGVASDIINVTAIWWRTE